MSTNRRERLRNFRLHPSVYAVGRFISYDKNQIHPFPVIIKIFSNQSIYFFEFVLILCTFQVRLCLFFIIHEIIAKVKTLILH